MKSIGEIWHLLQKDFLLEFRTGYAISGIFLYLFGTVYIVSRAFQQIKPESWNALFWIIILFASVNAVTKSFVQESNQRQLYFYSIANPIAILLSKIIYNILLLLALSFLTWGALSFMTIDPILKPDVFSLTLLLGSVGFSINFTFISAIAVKANNNSTLMSILSFPLVIPVLLLLVKLTANSIGLIEQDITNDILLLLGIDLLLLAMTLVLYPFLWRD
jgi:heme exporter protein B